MSKEVGYARVSSTDQNLSRQITQLLKYVPEDMIVTDKISGKNFDRPGYQSLKVGIGKLQKGDTLYIYEMDRLGRNKEESKDELKYWKEKGVRVKIITLPTTMTEIPDGQDWVMDMINNILIEVYTSIAEHEREHINQRRKEGVAEMEEKPDINGKIKKHSIKTNRPLGRPLAEFPVNWESVYRQWKNKEITAVSAMDLLGLKKNTFYSLVKRYEK